MAVVFMFLDISEHGVWRRRPRDLLRGDTPGDQQMNEPDWRTNQSIPKRRCSLPRMTRFAMAVLASFHTRPTIYKQEEANADSLPSQLILDVAAFPILH